MFGEQLDRDVALKPVVEGELHRGHAADAQAALELVAVGDRLCGVHGVGASVPPPVSPVPVGGGSSVVVGGGSVVAVVSVWVVSVGVVSVVVVSVWVVSVGGVSVGVVVVVPWHSRAARWARFWKPSSRFARSPESTFAGSS